VLSVSIDMCAGGSRSGGWTVSGKQGMVVGAAQFEALGASQSLRRTPISL